MSSTLVLPYSLSPMRVAFLELGDKLSLRSNPCPGKDREYEKKSAHRLQIKLNYNKPNQTQPGDSKVTTWLMAAGRLDVTAGEL